MTVTNSDARGFYSRLEMRNMSPRFFDRFQTSSLALGNSINANSMHVTMRNIPSENERKTNLRCSLNDEELDELCTQHRFESWPQRLKRVEVWQKPLSAIRFAKPE